MTLLGTWYGQLAFWLLLTFIPLLPRTVSPPIAFAHVGCCSYFCLQCCRVTSVACVQSTTPSLQNIHFVMGTGKSMQMQRLSMSQCKKPVSCMTEGWLQSHTVWSCGATMQCTNRRLVHLWRRLRGARSPSLSSYFVQQLHITTTICSSSLCLV